MRKIKKIISSVFHRGSIVLAKDVKAFISQAKSDALVAVKDSSPEVQAAVQIAVESLEKAALAAIEARLA